MYFGCYGLLLNPNDHSYWSMLPPYVSPRALQRFDNQAGSKAKMFQKERNAAIHLESSEVFVDTGINRPFIVRAETNELEYGRPLATTNPAASTQNKTIHDMHIKPFP